MLRPFEQRPFDAIPAKPAPHPFFGLPERIVDVWTENFGHVRTSYRQVGSGPPLLLLHGLMTTGYSWRRVIAPLAEEFTVIVPDLVGAGRTDKPDARYVPSEIGTWLTAFQDAIRVPRCAVIGNSMGGYVAMQWALQRPEGIRRLVNLHSPGLWEPRLAALWLAMRLPGSEALLRGLVGRDPRRWAHRRVHYWDESLKSVEEAAEYGDVLGTPAGLRGFHRQLRDTMDAVAIARFDRSMRARHDAGCDFPVPLMLVYARQDPVVPPRVGRVLAQRLPNAAYRWLDEASHFAQVDAPERFLAAVLPFLRGEL